MMRFNCAPQSHHMWFSVVRQYNDRFQQYFNQINIRTFITIYMISLISHFVLRQSCKMWTPWLASLGESPKINHIGPTPPTCGKMSPKTWMMIMMMMKAGWHYIDVIIDCSLNRLFRHRSKKTSKICVTGLCAGNSPVTGEFPHKGPVTGKMLPSDDDIMETMHC